MKGGTNISNVMCLIMFSGANRGLADLATSARRSLVVLSRYIAFRTIVQGSSAPTSIAGWLLRCFVEAGDDDGLLVGVGESESSALWPRLTL